MPARGNIAATISDIALRLAQGPAPRADEMADFGLAPVPGARATGRRAEFRGESPYPEFAGLGFLFERPPHLAHGRVTMLLTPAPDRRLGRADLEAAIGPARRVPTLDGVLMSFDAAVSEDGLVTAWAVPHPDDAPAPGPDARIGQVRLERLDWPDDAALNVRAVALLLADPDMTPAQAARTLGVPPDADAHPVADRVAEFLAPDESLQDTGYARVGLWVWQDDGPGSEDVGDALVAAVRLTPADDRPLMLSDLSHLLGVGERPAGMTPRAEGEESVRFTLDARPGEAPVTIYASVLPAPAGGDAPVVDVLLYRDLPPDGPLLL